MTPIIGEARAADLVAEYRGGNSLGVGTPEQLVERFADMAARRLGHQIHFFTEAVHDRSSIELFESEIMPALA